jgi:hypothetical protein
MGAMMTAIPPLPPEIAAQQQQPVGPMFAQMASGGGLPDPIGVAEMKLAELEQWAGSFAPLLSQINPGLATLLVPIAQAGKALQSEIGNLRARTAAPSPAEAGSMPPNLPGNIPGGQPAV